MKKLMYVTFCVVLGMVLCGTAQAANLLLNPSFEAGVGGYSGQFPDNWTCSGATGIETWAAYSGTYGEAVYWWSNGGNASFNQDVAVTAGQAYEFSCWTLRDNSGQWVEGVFVPVTLAGTYTMKIDWLAGTTLLGTSSWDITSEIGVDTVTGWLQLTKSGTVMAGSDTARVGFESAGVNVAAKFDDASFVPEPATMVLLGLGSLYLARRRK